MVKIICQTERACKWAKENLETEEYQWLTDNIVAVDNRYVKDIVDAAQIGELVAGIDMLLVYEGISSWDINGNELHYNEVGQEGE